MLTKRWWPIFEKGMGNSKIEYRIESSLFHLVRSAQRDKFTNNFQSWHSMVENALTVVRQKPQTKTKPGTDPEPKQPIWRYNERFAKKYGENGRPSNVFLNYQPPSSRTRLRDADGKELRNNAEKSRTWRGI